MTLHCWKCFRYMNAHTIRTVLKYSLSVRYMNLEIYKLEILPTGYFWLSKSDQHTINVAALDTECQRPLVTGWKLPSLSSSNKTLNPKKFASFPFDGPKSYPFHMRQSFSGGLLLLSNLRLDRVCHALADWPAQVGDVVRWLVDCWLIALDWLVLGWWNCGLLI